jgi:cytochrome c biogenesis protein CcmG/thiol:disulfide interchange protein DsbE
MTGPAVPRARRRRRLMAWIAALVVVLVLAVGTALGSRLGTDPALVDSPLIGQPAPSVQLPALQGGEPVSLAAPRGQVVVVNFWASWCVPCRQEHPTLVAAANAYRPAGVTFLGVVYQDRAESAIAFLDELGRAQGYLYATDPGSRTAVEFGVFGIPETFVLDRSGVIVAKITGASNYPLLSGVLDAVIAGRPPSSIVAGTTSTAPSGAGG